MTPRDATHAFINELASPYGFSVADILGPERKRNVAWVRHMVMARFSASRPAMSTLRIGALFGGRDHSTVIHAIRSHHARMAWVEVLRLCADVPEQPDLFSVAA